MRSPAHVVRPFPRPRSSSPVGSVTPARTPRLHGSRSQKRHFTAAMASPRASLESDVLPVHADLEVEVIGDAVTEHSGSLRAAHRLVVEPILVALAVQLELPFASSLDPRIFGIERMGAVGTRSKDNR